MSRTTVSRHALALLFVACVTAGCTRPGDLSITAAYLLPPLPGQTTAVAYFTVVNHDQRDWVLVSAHSPMASSIEIHETVRDGEFLRMRRLEAVTLAPGQLASFEPGGPHLMVFNYDNPSAAPVPVTLAFRDGTTRVVEFEARARGAPR
jgi:copper(I)-binding protein